MPLIKILVWKDRLNAHKKVTISRFIVSCRDNGYYKVVARHLYDDDISINLEVNNLNQISSDKQAIEYGQINLKGHESKLLSDLHRSTKDNIYLRRMEIDIENAVLSFLSKKTEGKFCYNQRQLEGIQLSKHHENINLYGDTGSVDTDSELNFSDCSGDTTFDGMDLCYNEIMDLFGLRQLFDFIKNKQLYIYEKVHNCFLNNDLAIYSDCVAFRKAGKATQSDSQLIEKRKKYWYSSPLYAQLCEVGFRPKPLSNKV